MASPKMSKLDHLWKYLTGQTVTVRVIPDIEYSGVLHSWTKEKAGYSIELRKAKKSGDPNGDLIEELKISVADFCCLTANNPSPPPPQPASIVKTDAEISGTTSVTEKDLQKWEDNDFPEENLGKALAGLEDDDKEGFDQFEVNKRKFGVKSTYSSSSDQYTTHLDKNSDFYKQRVAEATKQAHAIISTPTQNVHLLEERTGIITTNDSEISDVLTEMPKPQPAAPQAATPQLAVPQAATPQEETPQAKGEAAPPDKEKEKLPPVKKVPGLSASAKEFKPQSRPIPLQPAPPPQWGQMQIPPPMAYSKAHPPPFRNMPPPYFSPYPAPPLHGPVLPQPKPSPPPTFKPPSACRVFVPGSGLVSTSASEGSGSSTQPKNPSVSTEKS